MLLHVMLCSSFQVLFPTYVILRPGKDWRFTKNWNNMALQLVSQSRLSNHTHITTPHNIRAWSGWKRGWCFEVSPLLDSLWDYFNVLEAPINNIRCSQLDSGLMNMKTSQWHEHLHCPGTAYIFWPHESWHCLVPAGPQGSLTVDMRI